MIELVNQYFLFKPGANFKILKDKERSNACLLCVTLCIGCRFSDVRLHTGAKAAQLSRSLNARAFTVQNHIHFGSLVYMGKQTGSGPNSISSWKEEHKKALTTSLLSRTAPDKNKKANLKKANFSY